MSNPRFSASFRATSIPTGEMSNPVTAHPCEASHSALRPCPIATSNARPGFRPLIVRTINAFGDALKTSLPLE